MLKKTLRYINFSLFISFFLHLLFIILVTFYVKNIYKEDQLTTVEAILQPSTEKKNVIVPIIENQEDNKTITKKELSPKKKIEIHKKPLHIDLKKDETNLAKNFSKSYINELNNLNDKNNGVSHGNIGLKGKIFKKRLAEHGRIGGYGDAQMQATLIWSTKDDLDLIAEIPNNLIIDFNNKDVNGGRLDIDRNYLKNITDTPVENIFWQDIPKVGVYSIFFIKQGSPSKPISFEFRLKYKNKIYFSKGDVSPNNRKILLVKIQVFKKGLMKIISGKFYDKDDIDKSINFAKIDSEYIIIKFN